MAATHGHLGEFDSTQEEWETYTERLEQYFTANDVQDAEKQRAILLSCCGASTYRLIKNVLAPNRPTDVPFDDIVTQMRTHFHPTPSETVQRYLFYSRTRRAGESVSMYVAELKKLAEFCNFGDTLEPMLRDRIVCGIGNERWQRRLLGEEDLTYKSAMKIVLALESADSQVKELQGATKIHHVRKPWQSQRPKRQDTIPQIVPCFRCGGKHEPKECRFKDLECHFCHKKGHISKVCRKKTWSQQGKRTATPHGTNTVAEPDEVEYPLHALTTGKNHPLTVKVKINNADLQMEVDTGATLSIISKKTYERLWPTQKLAPLLKFSHATLKTYTGEQIKVLGSIDVNVTYQTQKRRLPLLVVPGDGPSLLGRDWLRQIKVEWSDLHALSTTDPLDSWKRPERPWSRLHADYAGPFLGKMFLIVVDAYSKWLEVIPVSSATSLSTIEQFRSIFSIHGLPEVLVTDNGTAFTSTEFAEFMKRNGVRHVKSAPYHPASNGLAERAVQTFKESMRKQSKDSLNTRIARFLFSYRITPHTTTGTSPAELLFSRLPRSHLDLLKPTLAGRVLRKQEKQKENHDVRSKERTFQVGDFVFICDFPDRKHWLSGKIISTKGPCSYLVKLEDGRIVRRHVDHIRACTSNSCTPPTDVSAPLNGSDDDLADISIPTPPLHEDLSPVLVEAPQPTLRRSTRISRPPDRYF